MKKPKPTRTPAQLAAIAAIAATKRAEKLEECYRNCRKAGRAVAFTFVSIFRRGLDCEPAEAVKEFERAVTAGKIVQVGTNAAGDVKIYLAK